MARLRERRPENADGDFFVDERCIDCDTCRWMAPDTFVRSNGKASVERQPRDSSELARALAALVSCPTASIGTLGRHDLAPVRASLPVPVEHPVYHCGYHHEASFGAASYLILREAGNVLVDSPRFTRPLVRRLEELGGVELLFLTHRDDVADHRRFRDHFGCERVIHAADARGLGRLERLIDGEEPVHLADDLVVLPVPGHTAGSACLLYAERFLFTGDHLAHSERLGHLYAFRSACWYDWDAQTRSMRRLARHRFEWVLPGHGRRARYPAERMPAEIRAAADWMESVR